MRTDLCERHNEIKARGKCKSCGREASLRYYYRNRDRLKEELHRRDRARYRANAEKQREKARGRYRRNRERKLEYLHEWYRINKGKVRDQHKEYRLRSRDRINTRKRNRYSTDVQLRLSLAIRKRINAVVKNRSGHSFDLVGCTIPELIVHLEGHFKHGMTWANHGRLGWHIDHIRPCASFDLTDPAQQRECFHYTNLQPLWAFDNLSKGAR